MKNKKLVLVAIAAVSVLSCVSMRFLQHHPTNPTQPTPPELSHPTTNNAVAPHIAQTATVTASPNSKPIINKDKHNSTLLKSAPYALNLPYYLLETVTDPLYNQNWAHTQVQAERGWDLSTGASAVTVAVIDSGFVLDHEDLIDRWYQNIQEQGVTQAGDICWTGVSEAKQTNNCDDDENGYVDDWQGYDFFNADNDPTAGHDNPNGSGVFHGTMVAGVIAATANNNAGSAGIDQQANVMPLQVFNDDGEAYTTDVVAAIEYATLNGARVINLSLGTNALDPLLLTAIQNARAEGVTVVAASGNCATNDQVFCNNLTAPGRMTYPAIHSEVIAVGATNLAGNRASFSSYGSELDLVAPGQSVGPLPTYSISNPTSSYANASGTSFAAPLVSGITTLLYALHPDITPDEAEFILTESTDKLSGMSNEPFLTTYGFGRVNAHKATLLAQALTSNTELVDSTLTNHSPTANMFWRTSDEFVANDEWILIGCKVVVPDECWASAQKSSQIIPFGRSRPGKADEIQYIFIPGSDLPTGSINLSTHNKHFATGLTTLTKQ